MTADPARRLRTLALACALALGVLSCRDEARQASAVDREWPAAELRSGGGSVEAALAPGEVHRYRLPLQRGQLLRLIVDQQGIDAVIALEDPAGARVLEVDRLIKDRGPELVLAVAATSGVHSLVISGPAKGEAGHYAAHIEALRPASEADRRSAAAYRSFTEAVGLEPDEALERRTQALATWRGLGDVALEAEALASIAGQHHNSGEYQPAAERYREAAAAFAHAGDHRWEAMSRANLGSSLLPLGEAEEAAREATRAIDLARRERDSRTVAKALHVLGQASQNQGELQKALDCYRSALQLFPEDDDVRPYTLHQLGVLYARYLHDVQQGGKLLAEVRNAWPPGLENWKARTLSQLGRLAYEQGNMEEARRLFEEALDLRQKKDPCGSAVHRARLALLEERQGRRQAADARIAEALRTVAAQPCPLNEPRVRFLAAELAEGRGDSAGAQAGYRRCEALFAALGDRLGWAESLAGLARAARALGDLSAARKASRQALEIVEGVRPTVLREDLRTSFFSATQGWFDDHIDLLLQMGAVDEAWATAEKARARALGDLLAEAGAGLRQSADPSLAERENALQRQLNALETQRLATSEAHADKRQDLQERIASRVEELEGLRGEIRRGSPLYASLLRPEPFSPAAVRRELLDGETVLLEYRLGETASTVWAVTRDAVTAARLPSRREIEPLARASAGSLASPEWTGDNPPPLCDLSRMVLEPMARFLGHRRLVVVADGALEALPFAALPVPGEPAACPQAPLLVDTHEVVSLPSAAALLTQRRLLGGRRPAAGWVAVVADPVYGQGLRPLPGTAQEAQAIVAGLPVDKVFSALGPKASRSTVTSGALRGFRILHFAAHGVLSTEQPLLSSLALSQGDLPAHEIYDLDLPAELVVLSACETALGRDVPGEGLVSGLPRAFLYAGATRVLVSLWAVDDRSTRDLMTLFYRGLYSGLAPARALQEAQLGLRREGRRPYQWAGFVLLGDWQPLPPFSG